MNDKVDRAGLGQQSQVDAMRASAAAGSGPPTFSMSAAETRTLLSGGAA
jgi:hypothetical protein